jgi:hypothetical protein
MCFHEFGSIMHICMDLKFWESYYYQIDAKVYRMDL